MKFLVINEMCDKTSLQKKRAQRESNVIIKIKRTRKDKRNIVLSEAKESDMSGRK
jgi:hypothetical protein